MQRAALRSPVTGGGVGAAAVAGWTRRRAQAPARRAAPDTVHGRRRIGLRGRGCAGPSRLRSPSRATTSNSAPSAAWTTSRSTRPVRSIVVASRPSRRGGGIKQFARRAGGHCLDARAGVALGVAASEQRTERAVRRRGNLLAGHVQQHDVCLRGRERARGVDAGRPGALGDPDDHCHGRQPPIAASMSHSATTAATSAAGTVSTPRRANSPTAGSESCSRNTRRHNSVASEPT